MTSKFTVPAQPLRRALETALQFAGDDDYAPPALHGVRIQPHGEAVALIASDRFIASYETLNVEGEPFATTIPGRVAERISAVVTTPADDLRYNPDDLVTFALGEDGDVTARIVGEDTTEITFSPIDLDYPDIAKIFTEAEKNSPPSAGLHFDADRLAEVAAALKERESGPVQIVAGAERKPLVIAQGDHFRALIQPVLAEYAKSIRRSA